MMVLFTLAVLVQQPRFGLEDVARTVRLSEPQLARDGKSIVFVAERPNYQDDRWDAELVVVDALTGGQRVLVSGRDVSTPRWAPAGDRIAFLSAVDGQQQVLTLPLSGGEPQVVTHAPHGVRQFVWSPRGDAIAILAPDSAPPLPEPHNDAFEIANDPYLIRAAPVSVHLWMGDKRLTSGSWSAATSLSTSPLSWSADGRTIAFLHFATPHSGDTDQSTVWLLDVGTGVTRALTNRTARESAPAFSPDGKWVAYTYPRDGDPANLDELHLAPLSAGTERVVTKALDRHITDYLWLPDGSGLVLLGTDGTRSALWVQLSTQSAPRKVDLGDVAAVSEITASASGRIAFVGTERGRPNEIYLLDSANAAAPRRLTDFNADIAKLALGRSEHVEWTTYDGMTADGVLTMPPGFSPGTRYPLVLLIHGGPTASSTEEFYSRAQLLAAQGWLVFQPNYRGSDNRGNAFQRAIAVSAAEGPGQDIMAGVATLMRRGIVDTARMAVSGWSYGGYMTAWLLGRYPTKWRAAVAGAAPVSLFDMYDFSDLNVMRRHAITASPWVGNRVSAWLAESPLSNVWKIRAPTLILSNTGDQRVAITGSYVLYRALRDNRVPVQFIAYPIGGHSPGDPVRQRDVNRRWIDWLQQHFQ